MTIIPRHNVAPSGTNTGWNAEKTRIRNEVNEWIRTKAAVDDVIDFDKVIRDGADANLMAAPFNCGDGIHPSPAGYYALGRSVPLSCLQSARLTSELIAPYSATFTKVLRSSFRVLRSRGRSRALLTNCTS